MHVAGLVFRYASNQPQMRALGGMNSSWPDCVVTVIDVIGIKSAARNGLSEASLQMRALQALVQSEMDGGMSKHAYSYSWNDSVLLLAFWNGKIEQAREILCEASGLKRKIDQSIGNSYGICMKGKTFPEAVAPDQHNSQQYSRNINIRASSFAMANCYQAEAEAKRQKCRADWYIDSRLRAVLGKRAQKSIAVEMLPTGRSRKVYLIEGYIDQS